MGRNDNRWRIAWIPLAIAIALAGCKKKKDEPGSAVYPVPGDSYPIPQVPIDAAVDAPSEHDLRVERVRSYLELLVYDYWVFELLVSFPGAPHGGTFVANDYRWHVDNLLAPDALRAAIDRIVTLSAGSPRTPTDDAVHAYGDALAAALPALLDLRAYYQSEHFLDDEFDRARREAPTIEHLRDQLATLRAPMRTAILTAWQELSSDIPDSPRAIITTAWRKCIGVVDPMMADAKQAAVEAAMSACRRSIPTVTALPAKSGGEFADSLRTAAREIGDGIANAYMARDLPAVLEHFTGAYLALWPTLPNTPAEHAVP